MLKKHSDFFKSLLFAIDLALIALAWLGAYLVRFHSGLVPVTRGIPAIRPYLLFLIPILIVWTFLFRAFNLYRPRRLSSQLAEIWDITRACSVAFLAVVALSAFTRHFEFSRTVFVLFWYFSIFNVSISRWGFRKVLHHLRHQGYNQRHGIIVGAGALGQNLAVKLSNHPEFGLNVKGFLTRNPKKVGDRICNLEVLGVYDDIQSHLQQQTLDFVFLALPREEYKAQDRILKLLQKEAVDVYLAPDLYQFMSIQGHAELFDGLPLVTLQTTPLVGWNKHLKRTADIVLSLMFMLFFSPLYGILALLVKLTSRGPMLYRQRRMGYDGRVFEMLKFRTMRVDAEDGTGAVWAIEDDPRRTPMGSFLRRTSLDELPQFWNVLKGEMSIVGPRPERPEFVEEFKESVPQYMLRHKIKAGITGLAQVKGWRGNTSIEERVKCDLEYIRNWNLLLDFKIMWLTVWKGFLHKNAY